MPIQYIFKRILSTFCVGLALIALLSCGGGGGGGGGSGSGNVAPSVYTVSTLSLTYLHITDPVLNSPLGIAVDAGDNLYVADLNNNYVRQITGTTVSIFLGKLVGNLTGAQFPSTLSGDCVSPQLSLPTSLVMDKTNNNLFVTETRIAGTGWVRAANCIAGAGSTWAGSEIYGTAGTSDFNAPAGLWLDGMGNLFVADTLNNQIKKITPTGPTPPSGTLSSYAGVGGLVGGYVNDVLANAQFNQPYGLAMDASGAIYVADKGNCAIRKISAGQVTTFAGAFPRNCGYVDGTATNSKFNGPTGLAIDGDYLYVADTGNNSIRRVTLSTAQVVTIAGALNGTSGNHDDVGTSAKFSAPTGIAVDSLHNLFVTDTANNSIRKITH